MTLPVGTYEYKYLVDGNWTIDYNAPVKNNEFGSLNNCIEVKIENIKVHPKKTFVELIEKKNDIKITSNISIEGLKIVGSWDNWKEEIPMTKTTNKLKGCD